MIRFHLEIIFQNLIEFISEFIALPVLFLLSTAKKTISKTRFTKNIRLQSTIYEPCILWIEYHWQFNLNVSEVENWQKFYILQLNLLNLQKKCLHRQWKLHLSFIIVILIKKCLKMQQKELDLNKIYLQKSAKVWISAKGIKDQYFRKLSKGFCISGFDYSEILKIFFLQNSQYKWRLR